MPALDSTLRMKVAIEVFSGSGHWGKAMANEGFYVLLWDITLGPEYDLLVRRNRSLLRDGFAPAWSSRCTSGHPALR